MNVRHAHAPDLVRMAELFTQLGYPVSLTELEQRWQNQALPPATRTLVAEHAGQVIGLLVLHMIAPLHVARKWAIISAFIVDQSARGKGAGALLLAHAEQEAVRDGCAHIELSSNESRTRAHQFYLDQGFSEVRKRFVKKYVLNTSV